MEDNIYKVIGYKPYITERGDTQIRVCAIQDPQDPTFIGLACKNFYCDQHTIIGMDGAKLKEGALIKPYLNKQNFCVRIDILPEVGEAKS